MMDSDFTFKYFGDVEKINAVLVGAEQKFNLRLNANISSSYLDTEIRFQISTEDEKLKNDVLRYIVENLKDGLYSETPATLSGRLFDLLTLRKLKIAVAESFTGGRVVSEIIKHPGASEVVSEGIVSYSNESKQRRLGVEKEALITDGAVSSKVAYQMAAGLLSAGKCDVAVSTTGIAGPNSDYSKKPVGLCYIAVGNTTEIHVYKYIFTGDREEITETAKNAALFLAIKNIRNSRG